MTTRWLLVMALLGACKREPAATERAVATGSADTAQTADGGAASSGAPDAAAAIAVAPADAAAAALRPTKEQALEAAKAWIAAAGSKQPDKLVEASALPFRIEDNYNSKSCGDDDISDAAALKVVASCLQNPKMRATFANKDPQLAADLDLPGPPATLVHHEKRWTSLIPPDEQPEYAFVTFSNGHPKYWSDVLYGLLAVRLVDGVPKVDAALLEFSSEGG